MKKYIKFYLVASLLFMHSCKEAPEPKGEEIIQNRNDQQFNKAEQLISAKKYNEAATILQALVNENPNNVDYLVELGAVLVTLNRPKEAIDLYQHSLLVDPDNTEVMNSLASAYLAENQLDKGQKEFESVLALDPQNPEALAGLGYIKENQGHDDQAEQYYKRALEIDPKNENAEIYLGNLRIKQKRYDESKEIFRKLKAQDPKNPDIVRGLEESKDYKQAIEEENKKYENLPKETKDDLVDRLLALGKKDLQDNKTSEATETLLKAHAIDPKRGDVKVQLAYAFMQNGDLAESRALFEEVLAENPENFSDAMIGLGDIAYEEGNDAEAEWLFAQAKETSHNSTTSRLHLAKLKLGQGNYQAAQVEYEKVKEQNPDNVEAKKGLLATQEAPHVERAKQLEEKKRLQEAAHEYEALLDKSPCNVTYIMKLADIYNRLDRPKEALELHKYAARLAPDDDDVLTALGYSYIENNDLNHAEDTFALVLKRSPSYTDALTGMGRVWFLRKKYKLADEYYAKALANRPDDEAARLFLAEMRVKQKRYAEGAELYSTLLQEHPKNKEYIRKREQAYNGRWIDLAKELENEGDTDGAISIYEGLIAANPTDTDYYLMLGDVYVNQKEDYAAIWVYLAALEIEPDEKEIYKAIGFAYLYKAIDEETSQGLLDWSCEFPFYTCAIKEDSEASRYYFLKVLELAPYDAEAYAGIGRIEEIYKHYNLSGTYNNISLALQENNDVALSNWADLLTLENRNFSAYDIYAFQFNRNPKDQELRRVLRDTWRSITPVWSIGAYYHQENEWDHLLHTPAAVLKDIGQFVNVVYPYDDWITFTGRARKSIYWLRDRETDTVNYALKIDRMKVGIEVNYDPYLSFYAKFGFAHAYKHFHPTETMQSKWLILPEAGVSYTECNHNITANLFYEDDVVEQDFVNNRAKLFAGYGLGGSYQYDFGKRRYWGIQASQTWFNDWDHNQRQQGSTWLQYTPDEYWDSIAFRYEFSYGRYNILTDMYYTYRDQTTHTLIAEINHDWLDGDFSIFMGYAHSWQRSFESGQVLVVTPTAVFHFVNRRINAFYGNALYWFTDDLNVIIAGDYSRDSLAYSIWTITGTLNWSF